MAELTVEVKATELPIVQEIIAELADAKKRLEYYGELCDYLSDNVPCWDVLVETFNEQREVE